MCLQVQNIGLQVEYNRNNQPVCTVVRRFSALALLKLDDVMNGYLSAAAIIQTLPEDDEGIQTKLTRLSAYVRNTFVNPDALFPPHIWNRNNVPGKHSVVMRSNNSTRQSVDCLLRLYWVYSLLDQLEGVLYGFSILIFFICRTSHQQSSWRLALGAEKSDQGSSSRHL